jgi:uncharacterized membrane protein
MPYDFPPFEKLFNNFKKQLKNRRFSAIIPLGEFATSSPKTKLRSMPMKSYRRTLYLAEASMIAALYLLFTLLTWQFASGVIQLRLSEALAVLPYFTPAAIPGLTVGCLLANLISGCAPWDVVFGTLATLLGAVFAWLLRKRALLVPIPNILSNTLIIPFVLRYVYGAPDALPFLFLSIGASEILSSGLLGVGLLFLLRPYASRIFRNLKKTSEKEQPK